ncbi:MAG: methyltransferase domain-containing protein [Syntrophomonadaceae bacterium]|jgi:ubiquinone/menaquinone biosynthesis C-methylase UbiE|nr:methyltransferase domain-containing protein [Syntrophomonadaceae bacterium]
MNLTEQNLKTKSRKYFDKQAVRYDQSWDGKYCRQMYASVFEKIRSSYPFFSLLDVGCGSGTLLAMIKKEFPDIQAAGIDLSEKMIAQAKMLLGSDILLQAGDVDQMPWPDNTFDLLVCNASFHHYPDPQRSLQEMQRVLKPQGRLVMADPWWSDKVRRIINYYLKSPFNASGDVYIYSRQEIENLLAHAEFHSVEWNLIDRTYYILTADANK